MEKRYRSLLKSLSWRITGTLDTICISFLVTGQIKFALTIGGVEVISKIGLYYFHERAWSKANFGRKDTSFVAASSKVNNKFNINKLQKQFPQKQPQELLKYFISNFSGKVIFTSSLGSEDQVLTDMCLKIDPNMRIVLLDTRKLHQETYDTMSDVIKKYCMTYEVYTPKIKDLKELEKNGNDFIYKSVNNRKKCCYVRKVEPLKRALSTCDVWITGLRRDQAVTRGAIKKIEWDSQNNVIKLNPLADWSEKDVWDYIKKENVPYNKLHDQGYPSIGCEPCTRAIKSGEDVRAGRWWWEKPEHKECGLHLTK